MSVLVFDFETTNLEYGSPLNPGNRVVMVAWKTVGGETFDYYGPDILEARAFWDAVEAADVLVAHNAKFEAGWLRRLGYDPTEKAWWDTMLAERVKAGNRDWRLGLAMVGPRYGFPGKETRVDAQMKAGVCPSLIDPRYLRARGRRDVRVTEGVYLAQHAEATEQGWLPVVRTRCMLTPILADIEANGMCLDPARVEEEYVAARTEYAALEAQLTELAGGVNLKSVKQLATLFYDTLGLPERTDRHGEPLRSAGGGRKTDKATVAWLRGQATTDAQRRFFDLLAAHAKVGALLSKNLESFHGVATERPGAIFHGSFTQHVTATHRLSAQGRPQEFRAFPGAKSVQFQNMPRRLKRVFQPRDSDYVMVEADGSQLEFRVAAFLGQDRQAMADIVDPRFDAHVTSASHMFQRDYDELLEAYRAGDKQAAALRTAAKSETFKPLYGGSKGTEEQERWYTAFRERYRELYATQESWLDEVLASSDGALRTAWGMTFYWDYRVESRANGRKTIALDKRTKKPIKQSVFNYPVQSLATAEIIPIALTALYRRCKRRGLRVLFVNTVHDSVVCEVHKDDVEAFIAEVKPAFTTDVFRYLARYYGLEFNVPLGCEVKWGAHWGEGQEIKYDKQP